MEEIHFRLIFAVFFLSNIGVRWLSHWKQGIFLKKAAPGKEGRGHDLFKKVVIAISVVVSALYILHPSTVFVFQFILSDSMRLIGGALWQ